MFTSRLTSIGAVGVLLAIEAAAGLTPATSRPQTVDELILSRLSDGHVPGAWVVVIQNGQVVKCAAFGLQDVESRAPLQTSTYMHIGSVCKMFTAACVMRLVDDGKLHLDDSLTSFFPSSPDWWKDVTVRQLLNQTSGIPDYLQARALIYDVEYTEDEMVRQVGQLPADFAAGKSWEYSNTNYLLLGILVHRVSGQSFAAFLKHRVLEPAGVKSVFAEGDPPAGAILSKGYFWSGEWTRADPPSRSMSLAADGCVWANADGFAEWDKALDDAKRLPKGIKELFWNPVRLANGSSTDYGAGWSVETRNGAPVYWHNGGWEGFSAFYARFPKSHLSIALCVNGGDIDADQLGFDLADMYLQAK